MDRDSILLSDFNFSIWLSFTIFLFKFYDHLSAPHCAASFIGLVFFCKIKSKFDNRKIFFVANACHFTFFAGVLALCIG